MLLFEASHAGTWDAFALFRRTAKWTYHESETAGTATAVSRAPAKIALWVPTGVQLLLVSGSPREPLRFLSLELILFVVGRSGRVPDRVP